jgi:UDP-N-acetyl-D-mannosaminuronic acid dehydrogenase
MQLAAFSGNHFFLGHAAMLINEGLPDYIAEELKRKYDLGKMTVGILGMAFKGDSDDPRESLSYRLRKRLQMDCRAVLCTDPHIADPSFVSLDTILDHADLFVIGAPHREYISLDFAGKPVVDVWNHCAKAAGAQ